MFFQTPTAVTYAILDEQPFAIDVIREDEYFSWNQYDVKRKRRSAASDNINDRKVSYQGYAYTSVHARILAQLERCTAMNESVLLVGDTGTGKTSVVQEFARLKKRKIAAFNFNESSGWSELIGGFHPVDYFNKIKKRFETLFDATYSRTKNSALL